MWVGCVSNASHAQSHTHIQAPKRLVLVGKEGKRKNNNAICLKLPTYTTCRLLKYSLPSDTRKPALKIACQNTRIPPLIDPNTVIADSLVDAVPPQGKTEKMKKKPRRSGHAVCMLAAKKSQKCRRHASKPLSFRQHASHNVS